MIQLYDEKTIDHLPWEKYENGFFSREYLAPLIKDGIEKYIANVKTKLFLLTIGNQIVPITVNEAEYQNSYVASNYYVVHFLKEWMERMPRKIRWLQGPCSFFLGNLLKILKVNRVVFINNWLLPGNPAFNCTHEEIEEIGAFLGKKFPKHLIMWRNIASQKEGVRQAFKKEQFVMIKTRQVYFYDPSKKGDFSSKVHYHHRRDIRLAEELGYACIESKEIKEEEIPRLLELYEKVYINKHTAFSPIYTSAFLKNALEKKFFDFFALKKEGKIDGVMGYLRHSNVMQSSFFGYETNEAASQGLYRLMTVLLLKEAEKHATLLNDGSGGAQTKKIRGLKPHPEYLAIYFAHLPFRKKLFWKGIAGFLDKIIS